MRDCTGTSRADKTLPGLAGWRVCDGLGVDLSGSILLVLAEWGAGLAGICAWQGSGKRSAFLSFPGQCTPGCDAVAADDLIAGRRGGDHLSEVPTGLLGAGC